MLIGLNGESRAGKDSVAEVLVRTLGFRQVALATAIRRMMLEIDPVLYSSDSVPERLSVIYSRCGGDWDLIKKESADAVDFMIGLGQSARDIIGQDVWINSAFPKGRYDHEVDGNVVISDIRQPNEVEFLRRWGGELWYVERPGYSQKRGMDGLLNDANFDATIVNNGTLMDLERKVLDTMAFGKECDGLL